MNNEQLSMNSYQLTMNNEKLLIINGTYSLVTENKALGLILLG